MRLMRRCTIVLAVLGVALAAGSQPVKAATISAVPDSGTFQPGESVEVDVVLNLEEGEVASVFEGGVEFHGAGTVASASLLEIGLEWRGPGVFPPPRRPFSLTLFASNPMGATGSSVLATFTVEFLTPGRVDLLVPDAFAGGDLYEPPWIVEVPLAPLGVPIASFTVIPEPTTMLLMGLGLLALLLSRQRRKAICFVVFGLWIAQPASAATITAAPDSGVFRPGESVEVDLVLNLEAGEVPSLFQVGFPFIGGGTVADVWLAAIGDTWLNRASIIEPDGLLLWLISNDLGGDRVLASIILDFNAAGTFRIMFLNAFACLDGDPYPCPRFVDTPPGTVLAVFEVIPEPSTLLLAAIGLALLALTRTAKRRTRC
jgi:hypothetical protein